MTDYICLLDNTARELKGLIEAQPNVVSIHTDDYGWENYRYSSPEFRMAHVEIFKQERFIVVHCCIFPNIHDPAPIFGFDVIAGQNKVTGVFADLSPTLQNTIPFHNMTFKSQRDRPEWGDIFSMNWIACRPDEEEMLNIVTEIKTILKNYFELLVKSTGDESAIRSAQNRYCLQQRKNEHTIRAISNLIGPEKASEFITTVLFPEV